jgi:hypothetical protein
MITTFELNNYFIYLSERTYQYSAKYARIFASVIDLL